MRRARSGLVVLVAVGLVGCGGTLPPTGLEGSLDLLGRSEATQRDYELARANVVSSLAETLDENRRSQHSITPRIRRLIVASGTAIATAGTVTSFAVDDESQRATIAQVSASVAAIAGIVALVPFGKEDPSARSVTAFLDTQLPRFEARWPASLGRDPTPEEWSEFGQDTRDLQRTLEALIAAR